MPLLSMSEYLSAILGKRKPKVEAIPDSSFTSYVTSESNKDMSDFVVIDRHSPPAHYAAFPGSTNAPGFPSARKVDPDYESLYSYVGHLQPGNLYPQFSNNWGSAQNMGAYPAKRENDMSPTLSRQNSAVIAVKPIHDWGSAQNMGAYPAKQENDMSPTLSWQHSAVPDQTSNHGDQEDEDQSQEQDSSSFPSFLDGVPFQLSKLITTVQNMRNVQSDSYNFLSNKASMLERLQYDFYLEQDVLQADDLTLHECN